MADDLIKAFGEFLEFLDRSERTIISYLSAVRAFKSWLGQSKDINEIQTISFREIKEYREVLINRYAPATLNQRLCAIKAFFQFLFQKGLIQEDPSQNVKIQKVSDNIKSQYLTRAEELTVMKHAKEIGKKQYAILMTLLKTGCRPSEIANLKLNSIYLDGDPTLVIKNSKRNKSRYIPIPSDTVIAIREWLEIRNQSKHKYHQESEYLFTSQRASRMCERAIQRTVERIGQSANVKLYCTRLRCSFANDLIQEANIPINILSDLLGHENISTSGRYLSASHHDIRKYVNKISEI